MPLEFSPQYPGGIARCGVAVAASQTTAELERSSLTPPMLGAGLTNEDGGDG